MYIEEAIRPYTTNEQAEHLIKALKIRRRWQAGKLVPLQPGFRESLYDHVDGMFALRDEVFAQSAPLRKDLNSDFVGKYITLHDIGEIKVKDYPSSESNRTESRESHRRREYHSVIYQILPQIQNEARRREALRLYIEYHNRSTPEAIFTKWLDVVQGNRVGLQHFFDKNRNFALRFDSEHLEHTRRKLVEVLEVSHLLKARLSPDAASDLLVMSVVEVNSFRTGGYTQEVEEALGVLTSNIGYKP